MKKNKKLINALGAQKTLTAVNRATGASHGIDDIVSNLEKETNIHRQSSKHTVASAEEDERTMIKVLTELKPFKSVPNRKHSNSLTSQKVHLMSLTSCFSKPGSKSTKRPLQITGFLPLKKMEVKERMMMMTMAQMKMTY